VGDDTPPPPASPLTPARTTDTHAPCQHAHPQQPQRHADEAKAPLSAEYIANQKEVDAALLKALSPELQGYLATRFTLRDGDRPHMMKF
jgi:hypothetical protein